MVDHALIFEDLVFTEVRVFDLVDQRLRGEVGQPATTFMVLRVLQRVPHCRVQDLSRHLGLSVGGASKAADRMERDGLCVREAHPGDRRSSTLSLTAAGRHLLRRASPLVDSVTAEALDGADSRLAPVLARLRATLTE